jgi:hypothetical protein
VLPFEYTYFTVTLLVLTFILNYLPPSIRKNYALINRAFSSYVSGKMIASFSTFEKTVYHETYNEDYATEKYQLSFVLISYD